MDGIRKFKYKLIKNFLTTEELEFLQIYVHKAIENPWTDDNQSPLSPSWYNDPVMNTLLTKKIPRMEKETGLKLYETYAFWRYYIFGAILKDHKDRPSCEISATVNIDECGKGWPIHMEHNYLIMRPGDAVIYLGCELEHGRKPFEGDFNAQVFLHYVDQNGPHAKHAFDNVNKGLVK